MKKLRYLPVALLALVLAAAGFAFLNHRGGRPAATPEVAVETAPALPAKRHLYTCSMHPEVVTDHPGDCPICGMTLVPVETAAAEEGVVSVDAATMQTIGVRSEEVVVAPLVRAVRTTGRFEASEQARHVVSLKIGGWVERLHANYEGARVRRGQPLLEIYSPELVATQEEYLLAWRSAQRMAGGGAEADAERLLAAARRRLAYWDVSEEQVRRLEETGTPQRVVTLYAPAGGVVMNKTVVQGQQVMPGEALMELVNLSRLWLMADVHEQELGWVKAGSAAEIELPYEPGRRITGRIDFLYDQVDPETRTVKARITLPNPGGQLKPGMYAVVHLASELPAGVQVPEEAVLQTGERQLVILDLGGGRFRPRPVTVGLLSDGRYRVLEGLSGGERVVTSAQFLIDSEARLKSAVGAMVAAGHDHGGAPARAPEPARVPAPDHSRH